MDLLFIQLLKSLLIKNQQQKQQMLHECHGVNNHVATTLNTSIYMNTPTNIVKP
jgi:hypothetical protein